MVEFSMEYGTADFARNGVVWGALFVLRLEKSARGGRLALEFCWSHLSRLMLTGLNSCLCIDDISS